MKETSESDICPVCNEKYLEQHHLILDRPAFMFCECTRCGNFEISTFLADDKLSEAFDIARPLISAWIRSEFNNGRIARLTQGNTGFQNEEWFMNLTTMGFPHTISEKLDALLIAYARNAGTNYGLKFSATSPELTSIIAAKDEYELRGLAELLTQIGYIDAPSGLHKAQITAKGWIRFEELQHKVITSDTAFIAMWFGGPTQDYRKSICAAVEYCGYRPIIVDQEEFSGFIMDQIVTLINESRFVIADFTCRSEIVTDGKPKQGVRGGVYWESGMAYGAGKPVIHTCEDNDEAKDRIHFDVNQYSTIFWNPHDLNTQIRDVSDIIENPTFTEKLVVRILKIVGRGVYVSNQRGSTTPIRTPFVKGKRLPR
ncbi:hypothetical protein HOD41_08790 [bacterium]|jgi:hypothetical protein|nr:hypothetical protein [bacterium]MBT4512703.1 hypothetical protein [Chloroflexota bacterium]